MITRTSQPASGAMLISEMKEFAGFGKGDAALHPPLARRGLRPPRPDRMLGSRRRRSRLDPCPGPPLQAARSSAPAGSGRQRTRHDRAVHRHADHGCPRSISARTVCRISPPIRFLYERLIGASSRPWLPAAFCAAAALPHLHPDRRRILLQSISESAATAPGWSSREPVFWPEWVEKVDLKAAAKSASSVRRSEPSSSRTGLLRFLLAIASAVHLTGSSQALDQLAREIERVVARAHDHDPVAGLSLGDQRVADRGAFGDVLGCSAAAAT